MLQSQAAALGASSGNPDELASAAAMLIGALEEEDMYVTANMAGGRRMSSTPTPPTAPPRPSIEGIAPMPPPRRSFESSGTASPPSQTYNSAAQRSLPAVPPSATGTPASLNIPGVPSGGGLRANAYARSPGAATPSPVGGGAAKLKVSLQAKAGEEEKKRRLQQAEADRRQQAAKAEQAAKRNLLLAQANQQNARRKRAKSEADHKRSKEELMERARQQNAVRRSRAAQEDRDREAIAAQATEANPWLAS